MQSVFYISIFPRLQLGVRWNFGQEDITLRVIVDLAAIVTQTVTHNEIFHFQYHVIACYLVEYRLCYFYMGGFVLHYQLCTQILIVKDSVATLLCSVQV